MNAMDKLKLQAALYAILEACEERNFTTVAYDGQRFRVALDEREIEVITQEGYVSILEQHDRERFTTTVATGDANRLAQAMKTLAERIRYKLTGRNSLIEVFFDTNPTLKSTSDEDVPF